MTGRIVSSAVSIGLEDRQLDVCWLELLPKIIADIAERTIDLSSHGTPTMRGLERHITKPVVFSQMTVVVAPPYFLGASDEQTQTGNSAKARPQSENGRAGPTEQAGHC
jgi:hypothetical protein